MYEHKHGLVPGFTNKYKVNRLVYFEEFNRADDAIAREKQLKGWSRRRKVALIESLNPRLEDLTGQWLGD
jgi:putative endonuclease